MHKTTSEKEFKVPKEWVAEVSLVLAYFASKEHEEWCKRANLDHSNKPAHEL